MLESLTLGVVVGFTLAVTLGLLAVASCHFLGIARMMLLLGLMVGVTSPSEAYPYFAQNLFAQPWEATGKIVCQNCHLAQQPVIISPPSAVIAGSVVESRIYCPSARTNASITSDGSIKPLAIGAVVQLGDVFELASTASKDSPAWQAWSVSETSAAVIGSVDSRDYTTTKIAWTIATKSPASISTTVWVPIAVVVSCTPMDRLATFQLGRSRLKV